MKDLSYDIPQRGIWFAHHDTFFSPGNQSPRARRPETKQELERRQAALFAFARAAVARDQTLRFAMVPEQQHPADVILRTGSDPYDYEPVQLKEVAPEDVNTGQTLEALLESIVSRYGSGAELNVAIHLNRNLDTRLGAVTAPSMPSAKFWLYGLCGPDRGFLVSDPFGAFTVYEFQIPRAPSSMTDW